MSTRKARRPLPGKEISMATNGFHPAGPVTRQRGQSTTAFLALGVSLALGLVLAAWLVAASLERIKLAGDKITVKGYAEEKVASDAGTWRAIVSVRAPDLPAAYRKLDGDSIRVVKYLESVAGDESKSLQQGTVNTQTLHEFGPGGVQTGRILGYELSRQFEFSSTNVVLVGSVASGASRLISEGVAINAMPPQYFFTALNAVKVRLIGAATRDSLLRAQQFAANSGVTVGPLRSASQGVFQITSPNSTETADYGSYDTSTVDKLVKAVVTVEYAVARQ
jgi:hypothetical protein